MKIKSDSDKEVLLERDYSRQPITEETKEIYQEGGGLSVVHWFGARNRIRARRKQSSAAKRQKRIFLLKVILAFIIISMVALIFMV